MQEKVSAFMSAEEILTEQSHSVLGKYPPHTSVLPSLDCTGVSVSLTNAATEHRAAKSPSFHASLLPSGSCPGWPPHT